MSCPVMHESAQSGGGCPVMHGGSVSGVSAAPSPAESHNQKVFQACRDQIYAFNMCQTKDVGTDHTKSHCEPEALALRECELNRRRREKTTRMFEECVKNGGDAVKCLQEANSS